MLLPCLKPYSAFITLRIKIPKCMNLNWNWVEDARRERELAEEKESPQCWRERDLGHSCMYRLAFDVKRDTLSLQQTVVSLRIWWQVLEGIQAWTVSQRVIISGEWGEIGIVTYLRRKEKIWRSKYGKHRTSLIWKTYKDWWLVSTASWG